MASPSRQRPRDLNAELAQGASGFGFFQAVRLLSLSAPRRTRGALPARLRFRTPATLSFPASELVGYRPQPQDAATPDAGDELAVSFMGLTGPSGALPIAYTELLLERRQQYKDGSLHAFFDLFSHRAVSLFYQSWRKYRYWIAAEAGERDGFTRNLLDLSGLGLASLRARLSSDAVPDESLFVYYAGLLSQKPLSAQALCAVVEGFFGTPAQLEQFVGQWIAVPPDEQTRLGQQSCQLGYSAFAGERVWDRQSKTRLRLGPMRRVRFDALRPGSPGAAALQALLQFAVGHSLAVDVTLVLDQRDVPPARLSDSTPPSLGGNLWLGGTASHRDDMRYSALR